MYIYERDNWPHFTWNHQAVDEQLSIVRFDQGRLIGKMQALGFKLQQKALLETLTRDVVKTSEIEGEELSSDEVRSSVARHLGMDAVGLLPTDRRVDGIVEILLDATQDYEQSLTTEKLCEWHALLFPVGDAGIGNISSGAIRDDSQGPMQVISGRYGKQKVHFQAPPAQQLHSEMKVFLRWFNDANVTIDPVLKSAIAHLWFVTLHPFDDGNGRIARAIADMCLARAENQAGRFYSMSSQIRKQRKSYYDILEQTQKSGLDITSWLQWFLDCLHHAIIQSDTVLQHVLNKAKFWEQHSDKSLNQRQVNMLNILFDGFVGKLTTSKWAKMMKCSQDTAIRDINALIELGILIKSPERGRSTNYILKDFPINELA